MEPESGTFQRSLSKFVIGLESSGVEFINTVLPGFVRFYGFVRFF
jgi:hypothetical protein